ncbi:MAG TPA: hypothetical protein VK826_02430 [Bacteroidia bacterium]|nr:hypothetical protein [Bacteroidia bacterium]
MAKKKKKKSVTKRKKLYGTRKEKEEFLMKRGSMITFKKPFGDRSQLLINKAKVTTTGSIVIINAFGNWRMFDNMTEYINQVDWEQMERWHGTI